jgi:hypothetical protein
MQAFGLRPKPRERLGRTGGAWLMFGDVVPLWREAAMREAFGGAIAYGPPAEGRGS